MRGTLDSGRLDALLEFAEDLALEAGVELATWVSQPQ